VGELFGGRGGSWSRGVASHARADSIDGKTRVYLENTGYFADFPDFCQILPQKSNKTVLELFGIAKNLSQKSW